MIPKIIHQIWSGVDELLPVHFKMFGDTWKEHHPSWQYEFWDNDRMNLFIQQNYPQYWDTYNTFHYNIQRWDAIRYLILDKMGGMYVDYDSECIKPLDPLLKGKTCCFSIEPQEHFAFYNKDLYFNNALMASIPDHPFMKRIIEKVFSYTLESESKYIGDKNVKILSTTGPLMLVDLYEKYSDKESIYLIPAEYVSPFSKNDVSSLLNNKNLEQLEQKLENTYSIHYFFNGWVY